MRRFTTIFYLFLALAFVVTPARADSLLSTLFPSVFGAPEKGPKPEQTLIAPFAQNATATRSLTVDERKIIQAPEENTPMNQPNKDDQFIINWAQGQAAAAFMFDPAELDAHLKRLDSVFLPSAKTDLLNYLTRSGTLTSMTAGQERMDSFTGDVPQMMNEGAYDGLYRWLIDVPVTVSVVPRTLHNFQGKNAVVNTDMTTLMVRLQIGRYRGNYADGIAIERFTVNPAS